ncbi:hypothetical protein [Paraflavitalea speifideaquila]|uniref:hypothetical protein n=1 Tax=Paraflavitalea speifideaquila TaxID=3076558 RepID=UPI0028E83179|nr:hypothetical protein [Paraflavitalea speifideiaquila]
MEYRFTSGDFKKGTFNSTKVLPALSGAFSEVETGVRMAQYKRVVTLDDKQFEESRLMFADSTFFDLFLLNYYKGILKKRFPA